MALHNVYRVLWFDTNRANKWSADNRYEFLTDRDGMVTLFHTLEDKAHARHVEVYTIGGTRLNPKRQFGIWYEKDQPSDEQEEVEYMQRVCTHEWVSIARHQDAPPAGTVVCAKCGIVGTRRAEGFVSW